MLAAHHHVSTKREVLTQSASNCLCAFIVDSLQQGRHDGMVRGELERREHHTLWTNTPSVIAVVAVIIIIIIVLYHTAQDSSWETCKVLKTIGTVLCAMKVAQGDISMRNRKVPDKMVIIEHRRSRLTHLSKFPVSSVVTR